ncbi:transglutaminase family protein [Rhodobaculum claviforme]|uniref:Transglutaminase n=1 Tax=Rhodobaculum claviforme TaxID=1549854 RepID=A0A934TIM0_9RHOB|nr:transglutaminase family protein [Rhodobaculum claviforme]MBK5926156.1 transglutaminase [Rhodobaculum claviforme]
MIVTVEHVTTYHYDRPVRGVVQSHRLTPTRFDGQTVLDWSVEVSEGTAGGGFRDGAGDWVQSHSAHGPLSEITVSVHGRVQTQDLAGVLRGHRERMPAAAYLRDTAPTRADVALTELARAAVAGATEDLDRAHRLCAAVAEAIAYRPGVTEAHTTAAEALRLGEGVCQDHAHALIATARVLDLPARYVSGYLGGEDADAQGAAAEAAHAWAEIWVAGLGWIGFDPANACCPDARYVRLGSGLDAAGAAPIRGVARGGATERMDVTVSVRATQQ